MSRNAHSDSSGAPRTKEQALIQACDYAGCTRTQAASLVLRFRGATIRQIGGSMNLSYQEARAALDNGRERLERAFRTILERHVAWFRAVLVCLRNHRDCRPAGVLTYAPMYGGGFDPTPVTVRARPHGSVAEDLFGSHRDFLRLLVDALTRRP